MKAQRTGDWSVMREAMRVQNARKNLRPKGNPEHGARIFDLGVTLLHSGAGLLHLL